MTRPDSSHADATGPHAERAASRIVGVGCYLPSQILENVELAALCDVTPEWIVRRTGIVERRVAAIDEGCARMGEMACHAALADAALTADSIDLIVVATSTPDHLTPPTACEIQASLGAFRAACFDVEAGFAGWTYALITADALLRTGAARRALVVGVEKLSTVTDRGDPQTGPLFGDGAGAVVLEAGVGRHTLLSSTWWADGRLAGALMRPGGGARHPFDAQVLLHRSHMLRMEGARLFRQAVRTMAMQAREALRKADLTLDQVGIVIPHQANLRIIEAFAREVELPVEKAFINIGRYGNTGAASIPIALAEASAAGMLDGGKPTLLVSFGAGATAGAVVVGT